jgi:hypothetical protein
VSGGGEDGGGDDGGGEDGGGVASSPVLPPPPPPPDDVGAHPITTNPNASTATKVALASIAPNRKCFFITIPHPNLSIPAYRRFIPLYAFRFRALIALKRFCDLFSDSDTQGFLPFRQMMKTHP